MLTSAFVFEQYFISIKTVLDANPGNVEKSNLSMETAYLLADALYSSNPLVQLKPVWMKSMEK